MDRAWRTNGSLTLVMGAILGTACGSPDPGGGGTPDASSDGGFIDGELDSGMGLVFVTEPPLPDTFDHDGDTLSLQAARITMIDLRLIGDAAAGDERTSRDQVDLRWESAEPVAVNYPDAPPGIYSTVRATVVAFELDGQVEIDGGPLLDFEVEHESTSESIEFELNTRLEPGVPLLLEVFVDLRHIAEEIPFDELEVEEGRIEVDADSEAMERILDQLGEGFSVGGELM